MENKFEMTETTPENTGGERIEEWEEKERSSDRCLEQVVTYLNDFKKFYESSFVKDTATEEYGFSEKEREKMLRAAEELKRNILDEYENNEKLLVPKDSHFKHLAGNSTVVFAGGQARRYESGKTISEEFKKKIKNQIELLNYYVKELIDNKELLKDELTRKDGYLQKFSQYFAGEITPDSPKRILIFKFFRDLETNGIAENDFENRLAEIGQETKTKNFLDVQKLEREGLILVTDKDKKTRIYKYIA